MNLVMTCLFTGIDNPLCPGCDNYKPDVDIIRPWAQSLRDCKAYVLHDQLTGDQWYELGRVMSAELSFFQVRLTDENLFMQRWRHFHERLTRAEHIDWVFITDGSDVRMLNTPWYEMRPETLYVGSEEDHKVSLKWIVDNHPSIRPLAKRSPNRLLLNAGIVGGDRRTVLDFLERLIARCDGSCGDLTDMAAFNLTIYEDWDLQTETGAPVHTPFNAWKTSDPQCWLAHK